MCITVFAWFTPNQMDCRVWSQVIAFGVALDKKSCNTKVVFNHLDRDSYSSIDYSSFRVSIAAIAILNYKRVTNGNRMGIYKVGPPSTIAKLAYNCNFTWVFGNYT
jgi:hypothetical protein